MGEAYGASVGTLGGVGLGLALLFVLGFAVTRLRSRPFARALAWALVLVAPAVAHGMLGGEGAGLRMIVLVSAAMLPLKAVVTVETLAPGSISPRAWSEFCLGWVGMQPRRFTAERRGPRPAAGALLWRGLTWVMVGAGFIALADVAWTVLDSKLLASVLLLLGLSLVVQFGALDLMAAFWRRRGVNLGAMFRAPLLSLSLREFWGQRWNRAFSEMTANAVHRPLRARVGPRASLAGSFLFSGLLHELAISVPVGAGYGLPMAYFALHASLALVEPGLRRSDRLAGWRGRAWTIFWVVAPTPLLFHLPFLRGVIWPLVG